jgi:NADH-quinone oxidoreductase subunit A
MTPLQSYLPLVLVMIVGAGLAASLVGAANVLGPRRPSSVKSGPFECGSEPIGSARQRFGVKFYVIALLFIVFDIEAIFIYPWAVLLQELGWRGFAIMGAFGFTLAIGLLYVWKKGALDWE